MIVIIITTVNYYNITFCDCALMYVCVCVCVCVCTCVCMCACVVFLDAYCVRLNVDVHCVVSCLFLCSTLIRRISSLLYYDYLLIIFTCCYFDNVL